jgi:hypothetical protein
LAVNNYRLTISYLKKYSLIYPLKIKRNFFRKKFGRLKISVTFAAAFRGKDLALDFRNNPLIEKELMAIF